MRLALDPFRLLMISLAGWLNQRQQDALDYLQEENCPNIRSLREQNGLEARLARDLARRLAVASRCYDGMMRLALDPCRLLLISLAGWLNQRQQDVIDYLQEENRVLREQLGGRRLHLNDDQRRRLAVKAKKLSWRMLHEVSTVVTP